MYIYIEIKEFVFFLCVICLREKFKFCFDIFWMLMKILFYKFIFMYIFEKKWNDLRNFVINL